MTEDFLHYIWKTKQFNSSKLHLTNGNSLLVLDYGMHNSNAGPDFSEAKVKLDNKLWAGHVEIHINSSDWKKHKHSLDEAYKNVILHVVYQNDEEILYPSGEAIPTLELKGLFDEKLFLKYECLLRSDKFIPCEKNIKNIDPFIVTSQYDKWVLERLDKKHSAHFLPLNHSNIDWREEFYKKLCYSIGLKVNAESFLNLALNLPLKILEKHKTNLFQIEALIFGVAGFLEKESLDQYQLNLQKEFEFLKTKYGLVPLEKVQWKFSKMHPKGFPTIRLAQLASMIFNSFPNFDETVGKGNLSDLEDSLTFEPSEYWRTHYVFGKDSVEVVKKPGKSLVNRVIINAIVPLMYSYGIARNTMFYKQRAIDILDQLPKESNKITNTLNKIGFNNNSGFDSQAILEMHKEYCRPKKCLNCAIGSEILKSDNGR